MEIFSFSSFNIVVDSGVDFIVNDVGVVVTIDIVGNTVVNAVDDIGKLCVAWEAVSTV